MRYLGRTISAALLAMASLGAATAQDAAPAPPDAAAPKLEDTPRLTVRGQSEIVRPADELRISIGVTSEAPRAQDALTDNNARMEKVVAALQKAGLTDDEYETGRFRIRPAYAPRPRQPQPDWKPRITGYEVVNTLTIRTRQLGQAGTFVQIANDAGADTIDGIAFGLSDPRAFREDAVRGAVDNAIEDARWMADASGVTLVRIINMSLDHDRPEFGVMDGAVRAMAATDIAGAAPISPGDVTVRAGVTMVWEIAPRP